MLPPSRKSGKRCREARKYCRPTAKAEIKSQRIEKSRREEKNRRYEPVKYREVGKCCRQMAISRREIGNCRREVGNVAAKSKIVAASWKMSSRIRKGRLTRKRLSIAHLSQL